MTKPKILIATRNRHKVAEVRAILGGAFRHLTLHDFPDAPEVAEDAGTFAGNAAKKAVELARWLEEDKSGKRKAEGGKFFVLADDSGLEVDALGGAPGVLSARFAALDSAGQGNSSDMGNNVKLLRLLRGVPLEKRTARFRCVLALVTVERRASSAEGRNPQFFEGVCEGCIGFEPRGTSGFGYDPVFIPNGFAETFAELGGAIKNQLSHRARALEKLKERLSQAS